MQTISRDGVRLAYTEQGQGHPPLVFVHGWSCDHRYFARQVEAFSPRHRTVSVDLRGHGVSDAPHQDYTMAGFADDVVWLCGQLRVEKPIIVGHSMGAVVALEIAAHYPDVPAGIIMVDGGTRTIATPAGTDPTAALAQVMRDDPDPAPIREAIDGMFLPASDLELRAWITEAMLSRPRHVMASAWEQLRLVNGVESAKACKVPVMHIQAAKPKPELARFQELCPQAMLGQTVGAGHFNMLEVPEQVNAMIARFLALLPKAERRR
ncbi:MAG: alpha/beta hydrolase [Chloroflexi bacterium]|nr:alpha/beta hydrolase [Chloroflexota bacterium]